MATLSDLLKEKQTLPIGNVYLKVINDKKYYYYQYFESGKRYTKIVDLKTAKDLAKKIKRRNEIDVLIKKIKANERKVVLSNNSLSLTGDVMCGDTPVATFENGNLVSIDEKRAPLVIVRTHSLESFLKLRVIDVSRTNARLLKKALSLDVKEDHQISLYSYALSISDNYWFKPKHSKYKYDDINFKDDSLFDLSLKGDSIYFSGKPKISPELTTTGSFEKGWKLVNRTWWLYKSGNDKQLFSELFCYHFAKLIKLWTAYYSYDNGYIKSKNFASAYNFEPLAALLGDNDNYQPVFDTLYKMNKNIAKRYLFLTFFDAVIYNVDRHNENTGFVRNKKTGKIINLAPNFDNNLALISTVDMLNRPEKDGLIKLYVQFLKKNKVARELYKEIEFKDITKEDIDNIIKEIPVKVDNIDKLSEIVLLRYNYLKGLFK